MEIALRHKVQPDRAIHLEKTLYSRSSSTHLTALDFVVELHFPVGTVSFDKGSDTSFGYYRAPILSPSDNCYHFGESGCAMELQSIRKSK